MYSFQDCTDTRGSKLVVRCEIDRWVQHGCGAWVAILTCGPRIPARGVAKVGGGAGIIVHDSGEIGGAV